MIEELGALAEKIGASLGETMAVGVGIALILFGRRLYWLAAAVVGFVAVFLVSQRIAPELSQQASLVLSVIAGVAGAALAVFAHKVLLGLVGGVGGALIGLWQAQTFGLERGAWWLVAALAGCLLGAWLVGRLFEFALVLLSSLLGAQLVVEAVTLPAGWFVPSYLGLVAVGVLYQLMRSRRRRKRLERAAK